jgi:hypothetical protein
MNDDDLRMECLKLAHEWGKVERDRGYTGLSQDDVLAKAQQMFEFVKGNNWMEAA